MKVVIRTDASVDIGTGHVMRCLTLTDGLREHGVEVTFVCREHAGNLCDMISRKGYRVCRLSAPPARCPGLDWNRHAPWLGVPWEQDARETMELFHTNGEKADWLIIDHYALDREWENFLRPVTNRVMVIDDLADRFHNCDLLLDQNLYDDIEHRYDGLVPDGCRKFLGPQYALLRQEFLDVRKKLRKRDGSVKRVLVFFGGADPTNETEKALHVFCSMKRPDIRLDVVVGRVNPYKERIEAICRSMENAHFFFNVDMMAQLMAAADLALGGGGSTTWERCFLGLPSITVVLADNQGVVTAAVAKAGATINAGWCEKVDVPGLFNAIDDALKNPEILRQMSYNCLKLMGEAGSRLVVYNILKG